jgi:secreted Zn-dependent insulinase-like peptidase
MTEREQRLLQLLKRLLKHDEGLQAQIDRLLRIIKWLRAEFERAERNHAIKEEVSDRLLGVALDEALKAQRR